VTCKEDLIGEVGKTARCEVVMSPANSFEPVITVTGVEGGTIDYEMSPAVSKEQLEKAVSRLVADAARAPSRRCRANLVWTCNVGAIAHCKVDTGGVTLRRTAEVNKVEGLMMNFDVVPVLTSDEVAASLLMSSRGNGGDGLTLHKAQATSRGRLETLLTARSSPVKTRRRTP
jgi:hypothetical protein